MKDLIQKTKYLLIFWVFVLFYSCATSPDGPKKINRAEPAFTGAQEPKSSSRFIKGKSFVHSLNNNPLTSRMISFKTANRIAVDMSKSSKSNSLQGFKNLIAAQRLAGAPISQILGLLKKLAAFVKKKNKANKIPEESLLELGLSALQHRQYGMAVFQFQSLLNAKNRRVRAGAYNAMGLIALREGRVPEAVEYWQQALKSASRYQASLLNLGFMSLKFGHFEAAKRYLSKVSGDWFAKSGLLVSNRLMNRTGVTSRICAKLLSSHPDHKPTVFNCGIHEWQSNNNIQKAKKLIGRALKMQGGPSAWDNHGYKILGSVQ